MSGNNEQQARYGWYSDLPTFISTDKAQIETELSNFVGSASHAQVQSWRQSVSWLQREYSNFIQEEPAAYRYSTVLEYELPRDFRRPDVIVLEGSAVVVLEVKGRVGASQAARDQVAAYARDLRAYHRACAGQTVIPLLVPTNGPTQATRIDDVWVVGPAGVHDFFLKTAANSKGAAICATEFLREDAYEPLPTIVQAARALYHGEELPRIKRARAETDPALAAITEIAHEAARTKTRHLILLSGVPGAGKTLVGLQLVHSGWLDDLAVLRDGRECSPAVYLSGNGPLVAVLQDALKGGTVPGSVFVQDIKKYVAAYKRRRTLVPPEHLIVFDEAQRAHDAERVAAVHKTEVGRSEPEHLLEFCCRIPEWSVLVALIGDGQAIHAGEEGGMPLWNDALAKIDQMGEWTVHAAEQFDAVFPDSKTTFRANRALSLDTEIRFHLAPHIQEFVSALLDRNDATRCKALAEELFAGGHRFLITRSLDVAKDYVRTRYENAPQARYGILASSKDKVLPNFGVDNTFQTTKRLRVGPWYNKPPDDAMSCCQLDTVATEFSSQGLELDFVLLAWGSDLLWDESTWSMRRSRGTRGPLRDPFQLRKNVYRVLLTRGRDGTIIFVPNDREFDSTWNRLVTCGFGPLESD